MQVRTLHTSSHKMIHEIGRWNSFRLETRLSEKNTRLFPQIDQLIAENEESILTSSCPGYIVNFGKSLKHT